MHSLMAFQSPGLNIDSFAAPVKRIGTKLNEAFLLQPGEKTGDCGMTQMKFRLDIPGTGRFLLMCNEAHNAALGGGEVHFFQCSGHGLVGTPVQDPDEMAVMNIQMNHLQKCSVLQIILAQRIFLCNSF